MTTYPVPAGSRPHDVAPAADGSVRYTAQAGGEMVAWARPGAPSPAPASGKVGVFDAPRGAGPYGLTATPAGEVFDASLAGNHVARIDPSSGRATPVDPPTAGQGARRVWADSGGRIWVSEWNARQVAALDPATGRWREWNLEAPDAGVRQIAGRPGDVWGAESGADRLVVVRGA